MVYSHIYSLLNFPEHREGSVHTNPQCLEQCWLEKINKTLSSYKFNLINLFLKLTISVFTTRTQKLEHFGRQFEG